MCEGHGHGPRAGGADDEVWLSAGTVRKRTRRWRPTARREGERVVMAGPALSAAEAAEANALAWASAQAEIARVARACAAVPAVEWNSLAGEAFRGAVSERITEIEGLAAYAGDVVAALRTHAEALRAVAAAAPELPELPELPRLPGLPNPSGPLPGLPW